jgi:hypothetical protein
MLIGSTQARFRRYARTGRPNAGLGSLQRLSRLIGIHRASLSGKFIGAEQRSYPALD